MSIGRRVHHHAVITCAEAAEARRIPLGLELKTLLLSTGRFAIAVHIRGDSRMRARAVKRAIGVSDLRFIDERLLGKTGLRAGAINPWNAPFCRYHLLCLRVLAQPVMATNDGERETGRFFHTTELLQLPGLIIGHFGEVRA